MIKKKLSKVKMYRHRHQVKTNPKRLADEWQVKISKSRLLKFCYWPATSDASFKGIFVATTNCTKQTNKAGSMGR
jgi:hypothetical protein